MKTLCLMSLVVFALSAGDGRAANRPALDEVEKLRGGGLAEDSIVAFIKSKNRRFDLSADDVLTLKNQGYSSAVIAAMLSSGNPSISPSSDSVPPQSQLAAPPVGVQPGVMAPPSGASAISPVPPTVSAPVMAAPGTPPNLSPDAAYFYQQLSPFGRWILADDNQWYWQPTGVTADWRPYADQGHWIYTDSGWYWASDYSWGWAPFHYGRWRLHPLHGWIWSPDRVWGPAWVVWRSGGDYCGWAPLPPGAYYSPNGSLLFHGHSVALDFDFGLDWHHFSFSLVRDLGEIRGPRMRSLEDRRRAFFKTTVLNTTVVTKSVVGGHSEVKVVNRGIEPARVSAVRGRTVDTVRIEELRAPPPGRGHEHFDRRNNTLEVYRPHWGEH